MSPELQLNPGVLKEGVPAPPVDCLVVPCPSFDSWNAGSSVAEITKNRVVDNAPEGGGNSPVRVRALGLLGSIPPSLLLGTAARRADGRGASWVQSLDVRPFPPPARTRDREDASKWRGGRADGWDRK